ncbi:MAG: hypothetical protein JXB88_23005 [Spirochaetales bacterium]|nr:hypothetical protein [Spirochaetales bacterium]
MRNYTSFFEDVKELKNTINKETGRPALEGVTDNSGIEEIIRWGFSAKLDIFKTLILILKKLWEDFLSDQGNEEKTFNEDKFTILSREETLMNDFHPDIMDIYFKFQRLYRENLAGNQTLEYIDELHYGDYDERVLKNLVQEILLNRLYFHPVNSDVVKKFIQQKEDEQQILKQANEIKQQEYWIAKCVWIELQEELSELLMLLEASRLRNGYIMREFLKMFGNAYVDLKEQIVRVLSIKRRMMLKDTHPDWSKEDVEKTVKNLEKNEEKEIERLKYSARMADIIDDIEAKGDMDDETLNEYKKKVKKVLKEIYFLLHPHRLMHNPDFQKLTTKQKEHLKKLWDRVMDIKQHDLRYPEGTVGHYMHSLDNLLGILDKGKKILVHSGLEINVGYIITGNTIDERIEWLNNEIQQLEKDIQNTKEEILILKNNKDILEKKASLACPSKHDQVREEMLRRAEEYRKEAMELEKQFEHLFKGDPS